MPLVISEGRAVSYAFASIHEFFDTFGFAPAKSEVEHLLSAALNPGVCKKPTPALILFYTQKLEELVHAAFVIHQHQSRNRHAAIAAPENGLPDISQPQHYMPAHCSGEQWVYFPRHLTAAQYHDPYKAIGKFCDYLSHHQWSQTLKELTEYALSKNFLEIDESGLPYNLFIMKKRLLQLIEAMWLIEVRTEKDQLPMYF